MFEVGSFLDDCRDFILSKRKKKKSAFLVFAKRKKQVSVNYLAEDLFLLVFLEFRNRLFQEEPGLVRSSCHGDGW